MLKTLSRRNGVKGDKKRSLEAALAMMMRSDGSDSVQVFLVGKIYRTWCLNRRVKEKKRPFSGF